MVNVENCATVVLGQGRARPGALVLLPFCAESQPGWGEALVRGSSDLPSLGAREVMEVTERGGGRRTRSGDDTIGGEEEYAVTVEKSERKRNEKTTVRPSARPRGAVFDAAAERHVLKECGRGEKKR
ncbi:hypothetical protein AAFF_G00273610 [Aldrovandia affinis]|uniref:Uncharacterized protein n=1 Tax=Aldrovandia affinis TaxID=143900 RepID=A0AAD7WT95_9TELE|nr:hypothetical protein AAFF_G00273610 [Aldrovandia affinis]